MSPGQIQLLLTWLTLFFTTAGGVTLLLTQRVNGWRALADYRAAKLEELEESVKELRTQVTQQTRELRSYQQLNLELQQELAETRAKLTFIKAPQP